MSGYAYPCRDCEDSRCTSCNRRWCPNEEPSPGEGDGICAECWMAGDGEGADDA